MLIFSRLVLSPPESSLLYEGIYDPVLVTLSVAVATLASYAALLVAQSISGNARTKTRWVWIITGGLGLGLGIWAMHFVGMLAFSLPCTTNYDPGLTLLSTVPGILASILVVRLLSQHTLTRPMLLLGGLLLGGGIGTMHYAGMAAMRLNGLIRYDATLFTLSIVVAVALGTLALWLKFRLPDWLPHWSHARVMLTSAGTMGLAVSGMHYTAMAAAYFVRDGDTTLPAGISPSLLAAIVLLATSLIIVVTIVATYSGRHNILALRQSYRLIALLLLGWLVTAWMGAGYYYHQQTSDLYRRELQLAQRQADAIALNINRDIDLLKGIASMVARDDDTLEALQHFGANVRRSPLPYSQRKQQWTQDHRLSKSNSELRTIASHLDADIVFILDAAGDCIAASNVGQPGSSVGAYLGDRIYFPEVRAGKPGHQYAVGRTTNIPGLYYAFPVMQNGRFLGAVVAKRNVRDYEKWIKPNHALLVDANGVIVLAADPDLEQFALPDAQVQNWPINKLMARYKRAHFATLQLSPWNDRNLPAAVQIGNGAAPFILTNMSLSEDAISLRIFRPLEEVLRYSSERRWLFVLLAIAGSMLIIAAAAIVMYIREARRTEADLRIAAIAFESQHGMFVTDANKIVLRVNSAFIGITGYSSEEVLGHPPALLVPDEHVADLEATIWNSVMRDGSWHGEVVNQRKNGELFPEWLSITAVYGVDGQVSHCVASLADITTRKMAEEEIRHLAYYDPLTGLPNRRLLMDRLKHALSSSSRSGLHLALIFLDLDHFKDLNDTLGHDQGDSLLQQAAARISDCMREGDTVARLGGDEFVIILEDLNKQHEEAASQARLVGEKIRQALSLPFQLAAGEYHRSASIGITLLGKEQRDPEEMLKQADLAMYKAKESGRDTIRFFDPAMQSAVMARTALEADLRHALQANQFLLYYQPQVDTHGKLTGVEALLRWQHPQRDMISPVEFIPVAEESGLIGPLGLWVLQTACSQLVAWSSQPDLMHITVAVNISAQQFHHPEFVEQLLTTLRDSGANPARLKLELTESMLLDNIEEAIAKMEELRAHGIHFSLDDFGTGYSSLSYLKRLPLSQLKIDQAFVRDLLTDPNDAAIASTIVALGQNLGLEVIAEGVETEAQREVLASYGCRRFQGYLFGRPQPPEQLTTTQLA